VFRPGDPFIKLSTPLPAGVTSLTINYETIDLGPSYVQGTTQISLATPLPTSVPPIDPMPIRVVYVNNLNHAIPNTQSAAVNLRTPLPLNTVDVVILYIDETNRYGTTRPVRFRSIPRRGEHRPSDSRLCRRTRREDTSSIRRTCSHQLRPVRLQSERPGYPRLPPVHPGR